MMPPKATTSHTGSLRSVTSSDPAPAAAATITLYFHTCGCVVWVPGTQPPDNYYGRCKSCFYPDTWTYASTTMTVSTLPQPKVP